MEEPTLFRWFSRQFLATTECIKPPVPLIYDEYYTPISIHIIKIATNNGIQIECFPPHATASLQPLGLVTLGKVKTAWRQ